MEKTIESLINKLAAKVGIFAENINTGKRFLHNSNDVFVSASVIKLPVLYSVYIEYISGIYSPQTKIIYKPSFFVEDSPWFENFKNEEKELTLGDLVYYMITVSDNTATNLIIDLLGFQKINTTIKEIGMANSVLQRKMCDFESRTKGIENFMSPKDSALFYKILAKETGNKISYSNFNETKTGCTEYNKENSAFEMFKILSEQRDVEKIPSGLNDFNVIIANKPGELPGIRNDAGIIFSDNGNIIISIFSEDVINESESDQIIANLSKNLFSFLYSN